jgi:hypothetical protein
MRWAILFLLLPACYVTGRTPAERRDACIDNLTETVAGSVALSLGVLAQRDYDRNQDASPPANMLPLALLSGGVALAIPGAIGMALTCSGT